jgi:hypothetical protein
MSDFTHFVLFFVFIFLLIAAIIIFDLVVQSRREKTASRSQQSKEDIEKENVDWVFSIINLHTAVCNQLYSAKESKIHANEFARLDYRMYTGFFLYVQICQIRKDGGFAWAFWSWYRRELTSSWQYNTMTDEEVNQFVDMRLDHYDRIMQSNSDHKSSDLFEAFLLFLAKDFVGNPLTKSLGILPVTETVNLHVDTLSLWSETLEKIKPYFKKIVSSTFYVRYSEDKEE